MDKKQSPFFDMGSAKGLRDIEEMVSALTTLIINCDSSVSQDLNSARSSLESAYRKIKDGK